MVDLDEALTEDDFGPALADGGVSAAAAAPHDAQQALLRRIPVELAGLRADLALGRLFPEYSRSRLQAWMREGRVTINGHAAGVRDKVRTADQVEIPAPPEIEDGEVLPEAIPLEVIHQDASLLVLHKPAGLVVHPGNGNRSGTLQNALLHFDPDLAKVPRAGIVHRLDKETSGLMVVARTLSAHIELVRQLQARSVHRHYAALVCGDVAREGSVDAPIGRHPTQRTRMAVVAEGRAALTHYIPRTRFGVATLLECRLSTGRTHQIRVHVQHIGHPMVGDPVYAPPPAQLRPLPPAVRDFPRQALHAFRLGLLHPEDGAARQWEIPLAADLQALLDALA